MASITIDLSTYKDRFGAYVQPGRYTVQLEDIEHGVSSGKKTPQLEVWLRILNVVEGDEDAKGKTITDRLYLTDNSMFRLVGMLDAIGLPTPRKKFQLDPQKLVGRIFDVVCDDDEPYNNRVRTRVTGFEKTKKIVAAAAAGDTDTDDEDFEEDVPEPANAHGELNDQVDDLPELDEADEELPEPPAATPPVKKAAPAQKAAPAAEPTPTPEPEELSEVEQALIAGNDADEDDEDGDDTYDLDSLEI